MVRSKEISEYKQFVSFSGWVYTSQFEFLLAKMIISMYYPTSLKQISETSLINNRTKLRFKNKVKLWEVWVVQRNQLYIKIRVTYYNSFRISTNSRSISVRLIAFSIFQDNIISSKFVLSKLKCLTYTTPSKICSHIIFLASIIGLIFGVTSWVIVKTQRITRMNKISRNFFCLYLNSRN